MQGNEKVALFDFCETLANFQTADPFVDFVRQHQPTKRMIKLEKIKSFYDHSRLLTLISYVFFRHFSIPKRLKLLQLRGLKKDVLEKLAEDYYQQVVMPNLIPNVIKELEDLKKGYSIYLVSGGYDLYLNCFAKQFGINGVISTKIKFNGSECLGVIDGMDCMYKNKVKLVKKSFIRRPSKVLAYSDSKSDLPLLRWADEAILVRRKERKIWNNEIIKREIVWEK